jgi:signal recognition particle protein
MVGGAFSCAIDAKAAVRVSMPRMSAPSTASASRGHACCSIVSRSFSGISGSSATYSTLRLFSTSLTSQRKRSVTITASAAKVAEDIAEVEALKGIRVTEEDDGRPRVEYLVQWKDGSPNTWEPASNLADNLLRDYENRWWTAVKKADLDTIYEMLAVGGPVLARTVDDSRRTALHFAAALNKAELVQRLLAAGAEVDLADKEGYTPLHMAAGYLHTATITELLANGADPEQKDRMGRSPLELVESFREAMPADNPAFVPRRMAVEDVLKVLTDNLFEDVEPAAVLETRIPEDEEGNKLQHREFLIKFSDEEEPVWMPDKYVSEEVIQDYESGLEYAEAESIIDVRNRGDSRTYLVRWGDGYPDSWEDEENVSLDLIKIFEESRK